MLRFLERSVEKTIEKYPKAYNSFFKLFSKIPDKKYVSIVHRILFHEKMNWDKPKTYTQKLNWLKVNYRDPMLTVFVDKCAVREYIKEKIGEEYLIPIYGMFESVEEIKKNMDSFPDKFALKGNNGSGYNIIVTSKDSINWEKAYKKINTWLSTSHYLRAREWPYKNVKPKMIVEKLLEPKEGILYDYKIYSFDGEVKFVGVTYIDTENHISFRNNYDKDFNLLEDVQIGFPNNLEKTVEKPDNLDEMVRIAETLSKGYPHMRVDLYNVDGKIYFGELTLYPGGGCDTLMTPDDLEYKMGSFIKLPKIKDDK
ncbi:MAG: glycosyl transferase [Clostridiales bacterium]|nr:MAG: glycosyl transferase [Clostridiales bacterium]